MAQKIQPTILFTLYWSEKNYVVYFWRHCVGCVLVCHDLIMRKCATIHECIVAHLDLCTIRSTHDTLHNTWASCVRDRLALYRATIHRTILFTPHATHSITHEHHVFGTDLHSIDAFVQNYTVQKTHCTILFCLHTTHYAWWHVITPCHSLSQTHIVTHCHEHVLSLLLIVTNTYCHCYSLSRKHIITRPTQVRN